VRRACSTHAGDQEVIYRVLIGMLQGKRPLVRPKHRREDNIKMGVREIF
jgi:hypothetical protein